jgi:hypothetical protein
MVVKLKQSTRNATFNGSCHTAPSPIDPQATARVSSLEMNKVTTGRPRISRTPKLEEAVLTEEKPSSSTRTTARNLQIRHSTEWRVLKEQQLYHSHLQKAQTLTA